MTNPFQHHINIEAYIAASVRDEQAHLHDELSPVTVEQAIAFADRDEGMDEDLPDDVQ